MNNLWRISRRSYLIIVLLALLGGFMILSTIWWQGSQTQRETNPKHLRLETSYTQESIPEYAGIQDIYTMTLPQDVGEEDCLCFPVHHEYYEVMVEGKSLEWLKEAEGFHIGHTPGSRLVSVSLSRDYSGKSVQVRIVPVYREDPKKDIDFVLCTRGHLILTSLEKDTPFLLLSSSAIVTGLAMAILALFIVKNEKNRLGICYLSGLSLCVGIWKMMALPTLSVLFPLGSRIFYYVGIISFMLVPSISLQLMYYRRQGRALFYSQILSILVGLGVAVIFVLQILGILELHDALPFMMGVNVLLLSISSLGMIKAEGKGSIWLLPFPLTAILDVVILVLTGSSQKAVCFLVWSLIYCYGQGILYIQGAIRKEGELKEAKLSLLKAQIQPHFIHNTLTSVYYLCDTDSKMAKYVLENFMSYLESYYLAIQSKTLISFSEELGHVKAYLAVQEIRYEGEFVLEEDDDFQSFRLPPMTLQPMVENAIRRGRGITEGVNHIRIRTKPVVDGVELIVEDDGPPLGELEVEGQGSKNLALVNVRTRLQLLTQGELITIARPGGGNIMKVFLPRLPDPPADRKKKKREGS